MHNNFKFNVSEQDEEARQSAGASFPGEILVNYDYELYIYSLLSVTVELCCFQVQEGSRGDSLGACPILKPS